MMEHGTVNLVVHLKSWTGQAMANVVDKECHTFAFRRISTSFLRADCVRTLHMSLYIIEFFKTSHFGSYFQRSSGCAMLTRLHKEAVNFF